MRKDTGVGLTVPRLKPAFATPRFSLQAPTDKAALCFRVDVLEAEEFASIIQKRKNDRSRNLGV